MAYLDSVLVNLTGFGIVFPLLFLIMVGGKYWTKQPLSGVPTRFLRRSVGIALIVAAASVVVSSILLFQVWGRDVESGKLLMNNLARVVSVCLCAYFLRNVLISKLGGGGDDVSTRAEETVHPLDKMFRHGVHAGAAAVIGLLVVVLIESSR